ncbi:uncharacterized protein LOC18443805 isoform X2 [Amborella trichopoda]|uniref:uncharacterized protein LOC18443805 isoform X2 n=1 Tax=Amborella trichopoda TaxID=13333 RepID=UPI0009C01036|nr:uncharacterized protein LOC18443805 isoform X2 [Amborella trichopoda]|eukprot:XP_020528930.1 uncharacterized protein LOC18443805 isoform X2 [Amborella trichopoda]
MSSPARSSVSATSIGGHGSNAGGGTGDNDNNANSSHSPFPSDFKSAQDRKEEAMIVLKSDVMAALQKEVKSLDEDSWKFAGPRSQIHLISRAGSSRHSASCG